MKQLKYWKKVQNQLQINKETILIIVVDREGSSPGKQGFKLNLSKDKTFFGTVGGGSMELNLIEKGMSLFKENNAEPILIEQVHNKKPSNPNQSGLICSGSQWVVLYKLEDKDQPIVNSIIESFENRIPRYLVISKAGLSISNTDRHSDSFQFDLEQWQYRERVGYPNTLYIFGAGHVGNALSRAIRHLDFHVTLIDDREKLELFNSNNYVDEKLLGGYEELGRDVIEGNNSFVVVVTYGYNSDIEVLKGIMNKSMKYIGVMGSRTKIGKIFHQLREHGATVEFIDSINAPIGINISDGSVEEIAISIIAELISVKNGNYIFERESRLKNK